MTRAVVPGQVDGRQVGAEQFVEDAFQILVVAALLLAGLRRAEEAGRRQLLGVADHHGLAAAGDGADGVPHGDLRGLVEDHQVERLLAGRQVLGDRQRRHQQARGQRGDGVGRLAEQLAQRLVPGLLLQFAADHPELGGFLRILALDQALTDARADVLGGDLAHAVVEGAEAGDLALVLDRDEVAQRRGGVDLLHQPAARVVDLQGTLRLAGRHAALLDGFHQRQQTERQRLAAHAQPGAPGVQAAVGGVQAGGQLQ
ncbi:hypothetical protein D3C80_1106830 [compost metagenome]